MPNSMDAVTAHHLSVLFVSCIGMAVTNNKQINIQNKPSAASETAGAVAGAAPAPIPTNPPSLKPALAVRAAGALSRLIIPSVEILGATLGCSTG